MTNVFVGSQMKLAFGGKKLTQRGLRPAIIESSLDHAASPPLPTHAANSSGIVSNGDIDTGEAIATGAED
jgi:hypothetical protein